VSGLIDQANALLTGGHVAVNTVTSDPGSRFAHTVHAYALDGATTVVVRKSGVRWTCSCGSRYRRRSRRAGRGVMAENTGLDVPNEDALRHLTDAVQRLNASTQSATQQADQLEQQINADVQADAVDVESLDKAKAMVADIERARAARAERVAGQRSQVAKLRADAARTYAEGMYLDGLVARESARAAAAANGGVQP